MPPEAAAMEVLHPNLMAHYPTCLELSSETEPDVVTRLFQNLANRADGHARLGSGFGRIAAEPPDMPGHPAPQAALKNTGAAGAWLTERFAASGVNEATSLARQIMMLIEGSMSLTLVHGDTGYIRTVKAAAVRLVEVTARWLRSPILSAISSVSAPNLRPSRKRKRGHALLDNHDCRHRPEETRLEEQYRSAKDGNGPKPAKFSEIDEPLLSMVMLPTGFEWPAGFSISAEWVLFKE